MFSLRRCRRTRKKYGVDEDELRKVLARIASKNHYNGARNPRAQFRREMSVEQICSMPAVAGRLCGVRLRRRRRRFGRGHHRAAPRTPTSTPTSRLFIKALSFVAGNGAGLIDPDYDYTTLPESRHGRRGRLRAGRRHRPPRRARHGRGARLLHAHRARPHGGPRLLPHAARRGRRCSTGAFDLDGDLPVNPDGGLKSLRPPGRRDRACA